MALVDMSGPVRSVGKLGTAVVMTVRPIANVIEMASESSEAWALEHAANVRAKSERNAATREQTNKDLLREALAKCKQRTLDTNVFERVVQTAVAVDSFKQRVHQAKCTAIMEIPDAEIQRLAARDNLTDADYFKAAKVGIVKPAPVEGDKPATDPFDLNQFTTVS